MPDPSIISAHRHSNDHRDELLASDHCGCFYCCAIFPPSQIVEWCDKGQTALCPYCGIDSVIGSASGIDLTPAFLQQMHQHWF